MSRDKRDLFDRETSLEESTGGFMTQIMKVKIFNLQLSTLPTEGRPDRPPIVREYAPSIPPEELPVFLNNCPGVISTDIQ